jgi:hypothetical protein
VLCCCDLHLGDSRLQCLKKSLILSLSCDLHLGDSRLQSCVKIFIYKCLSIVTDYRLNANHNLRMYRYHPKRIVTKYECYVLCCCDLHLGDSRLQCLKKSLILSLSCDLHLGDSRLQYIKMNYYIYDSCATINSVIVTDYRLNANHNKWHVERVV